MASVQDMLDRIAPLLSNISDSVFDTFYSVNNAVYGDIPYLWIISDEMQQAMPSTEWTQFWKLHLIYVKKVFLEMPTLDIEARQFVRLKTASLALVNLLRIQK